jgi:hypothetical protein
VPSAVVTASRQPTSRRDVSRSIRAPARPALARTRTEPFSSSS